MPPLVSRLFPTDVGVVVRRFHYVSPIPSMALDARQRPKESRETVPPSDS
jgi:hypothetical protein